MRVGSRVAALLGAVLLASAVRADAPPVGPDDSTPLQWAAYRGDVAEVKRLLAAGADVRAANAYGVTAMELAGETGNAAILRLLLAAGADVESPNAEGQ